MYRLLEVGEVIEKGDEFWCQYKWCLRDRVGGVVDRWDMPTRRLVKPDVTPAALPDPGEGYRLIDKAVDKPEPGDEIWISVDKGWEPRHRAYAKEPFFPANVYRRRKIEKPAVPAVDPGEGWRLLEPDETIQKDDRYFDSGSWVVPIESVGKTVREAMEIWPRVIQAVRRREGKPAPVVSVGDRVKVLSGPWAGCTGVVIALDAYVLLSDYGKMTAKYDSTPVIELEHVRVGGDKLILSKVTVERLPPVVPEVLYRDLAIGEVIRQGDEIQMTKQGKWESVGSSAGTKVGNNHSDGRLYFFRRPVRLQSPGWRYLDAGETVQAGDEVWSGFFNRYVPASADRGSVAQCEKLFRRKLPANQGG